MGNEAESLGLRAKREALVSDDVLGHDGLRGVRSVGRSLHRIEVGPGTRGHGGSATLHHGNVVPTPGAVGFQAVDHDDLAGGESKVCHA